MVEMRLQRPVQWIILCLLRSNELSVRHLIEDLDGKTTGPKGFTRPLGRQLNNCKKLSVAEFDAIISPNIKINDTELSTDQKYLLDIYRVVSSGSCSSSLATRNRGKMVHSKVADNSKQIFAPLRFNQ